MKNHVIRIEKVAKENLYCSFANIRNTQSFFIENKENVAGHTTSMTVITKRDFSSHQSSITITTDPDAADKDPERHHRIPDWKN